ncbi:MAG: UDP-glucose 6-dehydrogenase, partial [Hyphomicrobiaceae bacterium]|nr:UDP-glucose 6-dehydrogenase [Hyphomicrobiaceae bacterium]
MNVTMIGAGYVGLVSGACFADFGFSVVCVDNGATKVEALNQGRVPIYEPGLAELVAKNVKANRLSFSTGLSYAVK